MLQGYPVSVLMTVVIGLLLYLCWAIRSERRRYYHSLSYWSVNEAVNDVPCGVCFSDPLGRIVLCNTKMQELSRIMTGSYLQDYDALRKAMSGEPESEGLCRLSKDSNVLISGPYSGHLAASAIICKAVFSVFIMFEILLLF